MKMIKKRYFFLIFSLGIGSNTAYSQKFNPHEFSFNGYLRTGIGRSSGDQMVDYTTPENVHKFRMGNEANHYSELQFNYKFKNKDSINLYEVTYMMSKYLPYGFTDFNNFPETAQLFAKINDVVKDGDIWVGKRYYDRRNVESLDYFWINSGQNAQVGIGLENVSIKNSGKMSLAFFEFSYPKENTDQKNQYSYAADWRYVDVPVSKNSSLNFWAQYGYKDADKILNIPKNYGFGLGGWWTYKKGNIVHTSSALFRKGSSVVDNGYTGKTVTEISNNRLMYDLGKANTFDIINNFVYDDKRKHAIQGSLTYQYKDYGIGNISEDGLLLDNNKSKNWLSVGFRYMYYINKNFNLAVEAGNDYMKSSKLGIEGSLQKITFSPQITWDYGYYTRPVIRPFITYAHWSDSFKGKTGVSAFNDAYKNKNQGFSTGLQLEIWW